MKYAVKPGDKAWITRSVASSNIGKLVVVHEFVPAGTLVVIDGISSKSSEDGFVVESLSGLLVSSPSKRRAQRKAHYAAWLKPQRDQPDDAVDQSAAWLPPVPLPQITEQA